MTPVTINGRSGLALYLDDSFKPVDPSKATMVRIAFDDGGSAFYVLTHA